MQTNTERKGNANNQNNQNNEDISKENECKHVHIGMRLIDYGIDVVFSNNTSDNSALMTSIVDEYLRIVEM